MAQAAQQIIEGEIPLIEEQVETGLQQLLDNYRSPFPLGNEKKDDLLGRFTLFPGRSLPEFDYRYAKAYEAHDDFNASRSIYAMVCDPNMPVRALAINELTTFVHPNCVSLLGAGTVNCSHLGESRNVLFLERPRGVALSEILKKQARLHEHKVIDYVLQPAVKALVAMQEKKISHGHIHPGNFYVSNTSQLGDCFSAPCSTQAHYLYEPLERLMADPLGRGEANEKSDVYSLAILAFDLMYGLDKIKSIPREMFIERVVNQGTYHVFATNREFSDAFQDFFRGILNENPAERWGLEQLGQWINGKRFNMIAPSSPKEATRPLVFVNEEFSSRRMLACAFHTHWREALKDVKNLKVDRWCEMSLHRPELAEKLDRSMRIAGHASTDAQLNDMLTRVIAILDPTGPLRSHALSLRPDAIGTVLADIIQHNGQELGQLLSFIENDFGNFWVAQADSNKTPEMSAAIWRLQKVRPFLKSKAIGFGLERTLYDLNPSLCCQSPLLKAQHVTTAVDALKALDALAPTLGADTSLVDRHIAAFIASKIDMGKEIRIHDLSNVPLLADNQELVMLKLLAKAQQKNSKLPLVGLCTWAAMRIEKMIDTIHNRIIRKRLKLQLKKLAQNGNIYEVMTAIINTDVSFRDHDGFAKAIALHQINQDRMDRLKNEEILDYKAKRSGGKMAMIISYSILVITSYITISDMFGI
ncbi:MAG: protein kinase domain-containing protein [Rickettsiales bacterium]